MREEKITEEEEEVLKQKQLNEVIEEMGGDDLLAEVGFDW